MTTIELDDDDFESTVADDDLVLVDFWAAWRAPCRRFAPIVETASDDRPDVLHGKLGTETAPRTAVDAGISAVPTLIAFRHTGALPAAALDQAIDSVKRLDMRQAHDDLAAPDKPKANTRYALVTQKARRADDGPRGEPACRTSKARAVATVSHRPVASGTASPMDFEDTAASGTALSCTRARGGRPLRSSPERGARREDRTNDRTCGS